MKLSIDTREDSHDDIKKVIRMLQHIVGENQEVFINQPIMQASLNSEPAASPFSNIFGDSSAAATDSSASAYETSTSNEQEQSSSPSEEKETEETSASAEDLFAELFSEDELKKMDVKKSDEEEDEEMETKPKSKKHSIELY